MLANVFNLVTLAAVTSVGLSMVWDGSFDWLLLHPLRFVVFVAIESLA